MTEPRALEDLPAGIAVVAQVELPNQRYPNFDIGITSLGSWDAADTRGEGSPLRTALRELAEEAFVELDAYEQSVTVGELSMPEGVVAITPEKTMIIHVQIAAEEEEEEEGAPAEDAAEDAPDPSAD